MKRFNEYLKEYGVRGKRSFKRQEHEFEAEMERKASAKRKADDAMTRVIWIDGKVWKKNGKPVEFKDKRHAQNVIKSMMKKNPEKKFVSGSMDYYKQEGDKLKESVNEATTGRNGVKCSAEKSQFGGYRAVCTKDGKGVYSSQQSYTDAGTAKKHAEVYADAYYGYGERPAQKAVSDFVAKNKSKLHTKKEDVNESLRSDIAKLSAKFPEGSKVKMKHDGKVATVLSVGKDFIKVGVGSKTMDHKPDELVPVKEGKLPPHLSKFFDKKGNLNKDAEERVKQGRKKRGLDPMTGKKLKSVKEQKKYEIKNGKIYISKADFSKVHNDYKNSTRGKERMSALDPKSGATKSYQVVFTESTSSLNESKDVFFDSYSSAISHALDQAKKKGYEVDEDDVFREITTGQGKPGRGKTVRHTLKLTKGGKPQRKALQIQVYNRETAKNTFELNFYIS